MPVNLLIYGWLNRILALSTYDNCTRAAANKLNWFTPTYTRCINKRKQIAIQ